MHGLTFRSFMYADDLILLAPSVTELQLMIDICCSELVDIDLVLNESKSCCIRIGNRFFQTCAPLRTSKATIPWSQSVTYLGVNVVAAGKFSCCFDKPKSKFYSSFNAIYSKLGKINNPIVTLNLVSSVALPCLMFAVEALLLTKAVLRIIEHPWSKVFMKLFSTFDSKIVKECQYYTGYASVEDMARLRKVKFMRTLPMSPCLIVRTLSDYLNA